MGVIFLKRFISICLSHEPGDLNSIWDTEMLGRFFPWGSVRDFNGVYGSKLLGRLYFEGPYTRIWNFAYCDLQLYSMGRVSWGLEERNVMLTDHVILSPSGNATSWNFVELIFIDTCSNNGKVFRMRLIKFCCRCRGIKKDNRTQDFESIQGWYLVEYTTIKWKGLLGQKRWLIWASLNKANQCAFNIIKIG